MFATYLYRLRRLALKLTHHVSTVFAIASEQTGIWQNALLKETALSAILQGLDLSLVKL
jgi:hypothetical protein